MQYIYDLLKVLSIIEKKLILTGDNITSGVSLSREINDLLLNINDYCQFDDSMTESYKNLHQVESNIISDLQQCPELLEQYIHDHDERSLSFAPALAHLYNHVSRLKHKAQTIITMRPFNLASKSVLIGANGSGKSRFSREIQKAGLDKQIIVIPAQKILVCPSSEHNNSFTLNKNYEKEFNQYSSSLDKFDRKLGSQFYGGVPSISISNFQILIYSLLKEHQQQINAAHNDYQRTHNYTHSETNLEKIIGLWSKIINHRKLEIKLVEIKVVDQEEKSYDFNNLSDGEKVVFYYIASIILAQKNSYIIIDEPENNLNLTIVNKVWDMLEIERPDCNFMYLTHDPNFAISRKEAKLFWIKKYTSTVDIQQISNEANDFPKSLLVELLGSRTPIIFCEGDDANSLDYELYSLLFEGCYIKPVGSCEKVIRLCKASQNDYFNNLGAQRCYGIIDRDLRSGDEIIKLQESNIFCHQMAIVENIFCDDFILKQAIKHYQFIVDENEVSQQLSQIKETLFQNIKNKLDKLVYKNIKFKIRREIDNISKSKNFDEYKERFNKLSLSTDDLEQNIISNFNDIIENKNYNDLLIGYQQKGLLDMIGNILHNNNYRKNVIAFVRQYPDLKNYIIKKHFSDFIEKIKID